MVPDPYLANRNGNGMLYWYGLNSTVDSDSEDYPDRSPWHWGSVGRSQSYVSICVVSL